MFATRISRNVRTKFCPIFGPSHRSFRQSIQAAAAGDPFASELETYALNPILHIDSSPQYQY
jgi:hypothetical protein